jgi:hypothetical protein
MVQGKSFGTLQQSSHDRLELNRFGCVAHSVRP